eukprot:5852241-Pleurochrysis_carterae.AAC.3
MGGLGGSSPKSSPRRMWPVCATSVTRPLPPHFASFVRCVTEPLPETHQWIAFSLALSPINLLHSRAAYPEVVLRASRPPYPLVRSSARGRSALREVDAARGRAHCDVQPRRQARRRRATRALRKRRARVQDVPA